MKYIGLFGLSQGSCKPTKSSKVWWRDMSDAHYLGRGEYADRWLWFQSALSAWRYVLPETFKPLRQARTSAMNHYHSSDDSSLHVTMVFYTSAHQCFFFLLKTNPMANSFFLSHPLIYHPTLCPTLSSTPALSITWNSHRFIFGPFCDLLITWPCASLRLSTTFDVPVHLPVTSTPVHASWHHTSPRSHWKWHQHYPPW